MITESGVNEQFGLNVLHDAQNIPCNSSTDVNSTSSPEEYLLIDELDEQLDVQLDEQQDEQLDEQSISVIQNASLNAVEPKPNVVPMYEVHRINSDDISNRLEDWVVDFAN